MKILLIKTEGSIPHATKDKHLTQIRAVNKEIKVVAVSSKNIKEVQKELVDAEIIAGGNAEFPSVKNAKKLKWIHAFSAGVNKVLTLNPEVIKSNILISNVAGLQDVSIAEQVLGFMLIFTRRFYDTFKKQEKKTWQRNQNITELKDKTVLVVGLGNIGTEIARLANCLGMNILGIKQNIKNKPSFVSKVQTINKLEKLLPFADFVVLSLPLTPDTYHLFDMQKFKKMKKTAVIINIGRGAIIHEKELIKSLKQKIIGGAALDVAEIEPLPAKSPLWEMDNVVITPHHSGPTEKFMDRAIDIFCLNLKAYLKGKPLPNFVDKKRGY